MRYDKEEILRTSFVAYGPIKQLTKLSKEEDKLSSAVEWADLYHPRLREEKLGLGIYSKWLVSTIPSLKTLQSCDWETQNYICMENGRSQRLHGDVRLKRMYHHSCQSLEKYFLGVQCLPVQSWQALQASNSQTLFHAWRYRAKQHKATLEYKVAF